MSEDGKQGMSREPLGSDELAQDHRQKREAKSPPGASDLDALRDPAGSAKPVTAEDLSAAAHDPAHPLRERFDNRGTSRHIADHVFPDTAADPLSEVRLVSVREQLDAIDESVMSVELKQAILDASAAYGLWLELDDKLSDLGLCVTFEGGCEYPDESGEPVGVVVLGSISLPIPRP